MQEIAWQTWDSCIADAKKLIFDAEELLGLMEAWKPQKSGESCAYQVSIRLAQPSTLRGANASRKDSAQMTTARVHWTPVRRKRTARRQEKTTTINNYYVWGAVQVIGIRWIGAHGHHRHLGKMRICLSEHGGNIGRHGRMVAGKVGSGPHRQLAITKMQSSRAKKRVGENCHQVG